MLPFLGALAGATLRLWRLDQDAWRLLAGPPPPGGDAPRAPRGAGSAAAAWLAIPESPGVFFEIAASDGAAAEELGTRLLPVIQALLDVERTNGELTAELAARYEEIDLLYSIGELLGRAHPVEEVASLILREVTAVVGARRAGLRIHDEATQVLRSVATLGTEEGVIPPEVAVAAEDVVVARAFRSGRIETGLQPTWLPGEVVAVPISYAAAGQPSRVIGTLALADRAGGGAFTREETKLIAAVATQIGAALANARLVTREREQQRLARELELAHDLQLRLMPTPAALHGEAEVAVRSDSAESLGGDFYTFWRLGGRKVGVMLGDVSSHGFSAALIAAQAMTAAGIHANAATAPDETLARVRESLSADLERSEMYLTAFYGVIDPGRSELTWSSAGHPYAWLVPKRGPARRLEPTAPPLGLVPTESFGVRTARWESPGDLLMLFTDGLVDQPDPSGERFGEERLVAMVEQERALAPDDLLRRISAAVEAFGPVRTDDRTLLILRT